VAPSPLIKKVNVKTAKRLQPKSKVTAKTLAEGKGRFKLRRLNSVEEMSEESR
jgi:hypothetical protein